MKIHRQIEAQLRADLDGFDGPVLVTPMTSVLDGYEHAVTDVEFGRAGGRGQYRALCTSVVVPGSLFDPPGRPCEDCLARLAPNPVTARASTRWMALGMREAARRVLGRTHPRTELAASRPAMGRT